MVMVILQMEVIELMEVMEIDDWFFLFVLNNWVRGIWGVWDELRCGFVYGNIDVGLNI